MAYRGLLKDADTMLPPAVMTALDQAFRDYEETIHGHKVREPGKELLAQLEDETDLDMRVATRYIEQLKAVIETAQGGKLIPTYCCDHHKLKHEVLRGKLPHQLTAYLRTVLELAPSQDILGQLQTSAANLEAVCADGLLVKFLRLDAFMANNLGKNKGSMAPALYSTAVDKVSSALSPSLPRIIRHHALESEFPSEFPEIERTSVGIYPSFEGVVHIRSFTCSQTLVFSTFKHSIDALSLDRNDPPDKILIKLGLTFEPGELWMEVSYNIADIGINAPRPERPIHLRPNELKISAVPSAIEARGYWPFKVARNPLPVHGFTRDLSTGGRGLPEIVHSPVSANKLYDAVVWPKPTRASWGAYAPSLVY